MFIDGLLSRFSIRTKVLFFVLPFILFISAVGLIGLYASGLLQQRMEVSNGTMRLLTGFRDVNSGMDRFLSRPTEETRDTVTTRLDDQQQALQSAIRQLGSDALGVANLQSAMEEAASVAKGMDGLWAIHQREREAEKAIEDNLTALMAAQMMLQEEAERLQRAVRGAESEAKAALRTADRLASGSRFLTLLVNEAAAESAPERQFALLTDRMGELVKTQRKLASALTGEYASLGKTLTDALKTLREGAQSGDTGLDNIAAVNEALAALRGLAGTFDEIAAAKTAESVERFATVDTELVAAEEALAGSRSLISGVYDLRILAATLRVSKDEESLQKLLRQINLLASNIETLGASMNKSVHDGLSSRIAPALAALEAQSALLVEQSAARKERFAEASEGIATAWAELTQFADAQKDAAGAERGRANSVSITATALGVVLAIAGGLALVVTLQRPIGAITATMRRLADGDLDTAIAGEGRGDEIGAMAGALGIFRTNARHKIEIESQGAREREAAEAERRRNDEEKKRLDAEIDHAVDQLAAALERLSAGDISFEIEGRFAGRLERLRSDFNLSLARLRDTMGQITDNVGAIRHNGRQMAQSTAALSRRTEQQAASLEETAAAVDEITQTVKTAADRARETNLLVTETKRNADESSVVVGNAVSAMGRIEEASRKIEQIIDVIEDIAFQTNLLALNAGVEAARAGEQGKGFAVVAHEVRELAQRSGKAAQEIKDLINSSADEVSTGAAHVKEAGSVLDRISHQITSISAHVDLLATASREQSSALQEVNAAVNQMDQMTQQNAAMVEEATAASHDLAGEADTLMQLVGRFRIEPGQAYTSERDAA